MLNRIVPVDRIKTLSAGGMVHAENNEPSLEDWDRITYRTANEFAMELASKLREFSKIKTYPIEPRMIGYSVSLDIIVPETPK